MTEDGRWEAFVSLIPDSGAESPAARFLLDVLTELTENIEDLSLGVQPLGLEREFDPESGICALVLATAESVMLS